MSYQRLVEIAKDLEEDYEDDEYDFWEGSPFSWIRDHKSATIGAIGRRLAAKIFGNLGLGVSRSGRILRVDNKTTIAVKFSMEWEEGRFVFEQIKDQKYDFLFCLGVQPDAAHAWLIPKTALHTGSTWIEQDGLRPQHTGVLGNETAWLSVNPTTPYGWLSEFGGTLEQAEGRILQQFRPK
jgi:hypothetical protein